MLEEILASGWVEALGWTLLHFIWQAGAAALGLATALRLCRRRGPKVRYMLACTALAAMSAGPAVTIYLLRPPAPAAVELPEINVQPATVDDLPILSVSPILSAPNGIPAPMITAAEPSPELLPVPPWRERLINYVQPYLGWMVTIWLGGVGILSVLHLGGWLRVQVLLRGGQALAQEDWRQVVRIWSKKLRIRGQVRLLTSGRMAMPAAVGWLRPVILLPVSILTSLPPAQVEAIILHELAHIRRYDYLVNLVQVLVETLGFYHPAVWWVSRRIRQEREHCCDDLAAAALGDKINYARALTQVAELYSRGSILAPAAAGGSLLHRITRLLGISPPQPQRSNPLTWLLLILLCIAVTLCAAPGIAITSPASTAKSEPNQPYPARVLHFPKERSLGKVRVTDAGKVRKIKTFGYPDDGIGLEWDFLAVAQGDVAVPPGKKVQLVIEQAAGSLSPLENLRPDDLYNIAFFGGMGPTPEINDADFRHLVHLTGLHELFLCGRKVRPSALAILSQLPNLERLQTPDGMSDLGLAAIAQCPRLKCLYIGAENRLTTAGVIPILPKLTQLEELQLGGQQLNDSVLAYLAPMQKLYYLCIWSKFTDAGLVHLKNLKSLRIFNSNIDEHGDAGCAALAQVPTLENIDLYWAQHITDKGLAALARAPSLRKLNLGKSINITDAGLASLPQAAYLEYLSLPHRGITDAGLAHLGRCRELKHLSVSMASPSLHTDAGIKYLASLDKLESLLVSGDGISDSGVALLAKLPRLTELSLSTPLLTNEGLRHLGNCRTLTTLIISGMKQNVSIAGMNYLNELTNLKHLAVYNVAQDKATLNISGLKNLEELFLVMRISGTRNNRAQDSWRDEDCACLAQLGNLRDLQGVAGISDAGMKHLAGLHKLERLLLSRLEITDKGMEYLSGMKGLYQLNVSGGHLTDAALARLEKLKALTDLTVKSDAGFSSAAVERLRRNLPGLLTCQINPIDNSLKPTPRPDNLRLQATEPNRPIIQAAEMAPAAARVLHFPKDRSMGKVRVTDANKVRKIKDFHHWIDGLGDGMEWDFLAVAQGDVAVPPGKKVQLVIEPGAGSLEPLEKLWPDDLYNITFYGTMGPAPEISDADFRHLAHLTGLHELFLKWRKVRSSALAILSQLPNLERLATPDGMSDLGLAAIARCPRLKCLYISENRLTTAGVIRILPKLTQLEELELGGQQLNDSVLAYLAPMQKLYYLCIWGKFTDAGLAHLKNLKSLRIFNSAIWEHSDAGCVALAQVPTLENINLHNAQHITDIGLAALARAPSLRKLDIADGAKLTDAGLAILPQATHLEHLALPAKGFIDEVSLTWDAAGD